MFKSPQKNQNQDWIDSFQYRLEHAMQNSFNKENEKEDFSVNVNKGKKRIEPSFS